MESHDVHLRRKRRIHRRDRLLSHRRGSTHDFHVAMPTFHTHPSLRHLSSDPISGIPYFYHNTDTPTAVPHSTFALNSPAVEIPSNMLGARARAAEYNAAKAATARQQATRESGELRLPPKPAPISLGAFTRNASYSRNRGAKNFVPLILSEEEEEGSISSTELVNETGQVDSSQPIPVIRPSSLPPLQTFTSNSTEMERTAQTPLRYTSPRSQTQHYTTTSRPVYHGDGYGFPMAGLAYPSHPFVPYQQTQAFVPHPNLIPPPPVGWYTPTGHYGTHCLYTDAGVVPITSFTEPRPRINHNPSQESTAVAEASRESPSKQTQDDKSPTTPLVRLGGPTLHVFGPDDLSPTKMEIKQQVREEYFANNPAHLSTPTTTRVIQNVSIPRTPEASLLGSLTKSAQGLKHSLDTSARPQRGGVKNLIIDHDSVAPLSIKRASEGTDMFSKSENIDRSGPIELGGDMNDIWSAKDTESPCRHITVFNGSPVRHSKSSKFNGSYQDPSKEFSYSKQPESAAIVISKDQPFAMSHNVSTLQSQKEIRKPKGCQFEGDQKFVIQSLLKYPENSEWWEFRGPSKDDRERMRMLRRIMSSSFNSTDQCLGVSAIKHEEVRIQYQQSWGEYERRRKRVQELADEMKHKWEYGGQFRGPAMTKDEAKKNAGTVEEVGHMMTMLGMLAASRGNQHGLGSRPYVQPPEYAIERSIIMAGAGAASLFEQEGDEVRAAPPRLARDPRFRAQLSEGMKIRGDEERIPRMFVSRSRMQN